MIVSVRVFSATELNDAYIFIDLLIYWFLLFLSLWVPKECSLQSHNKNRSLTYRVCGKEQDKQGKELHFSNIPL